MLPKMCWNSGGPTEGNIEALLEITQEIMWVDEVIPDAPWVVTLEFLDKHQIDFVAHDSLQ